MEREEGLDKEAKVEKLLRGLLPKLKGAAPASALREAKEYIEGNDFGAALETLSGVLVEEGGKLSKGAFTDLLKTAELLSMPDEMKFMEKHLAARVK